MSLRPEEIVVGHVYRGKHATERMIVSSLWPVGNPRTVKFRRFDEGLTTRKVSLKSFAHWAVADITQEEKA